MPVLHRSAEYPTPQMRAQGLRCGCLQFWQDECRAEFRANLVASMDAQAVDALVYPTWSNPARVLEDDANADGASSHHTRLHRKLSGALTDPEVPPLRVQRSATTVQTLRRIQERPRSQCQCRSPAQVIPKRMR
jgi:hypothetical protein